MQSAAFVIHALIGIVATIAYFNFLSAEYNLAPPQTIESKAKLTITLNLLIAILDCSV